MSPLSIMTDCGTDVLPAAPLTLVPNTSGRTPPLSAHSQLGSPLDTPSLSVIVTPALGFFDPSAPQPVLQELKGALPRRGWMDKALGNKSLVRVGYEEPRTC